MLATLALGLASLAAPPPADRPNIVLIIADDLGAADCGPFGNPKVGTPQLDRLARAGMCFDRAMLTTSSCSPSRSSILTGRYPHATGAPELHQPLPADQVGFAEELRAAGYWTAAAGKWHLGPNARKGFDQIRDATPNRPRAPGEPADGPDPIPGGEDRWVPALRDRPRDRPFFLWLAALDPHRDYQPGTLATPHDPAGVAVPPTLPDVPEVRADLARYYDEIGRLDFHVGRVLDEIDRQGVAGSTLVLFLSDNGRPFPRDKTTLYDSGIKTPLIAAWPGRIAPGARCGSLVSAVDLAPTILRAAGVEVPATVQGRDLSATFADPAASVRPFAYAERNWHDFAFRGRAVRSDRFKLIRNDDADRPLTPPADAVKGPSFQAMRRLRDANQLAPGLRACFDAPRPREELYDLEADPHELTNLAAKPEHAATLATLRDALANWARETADDAPPSATPDRFDRETGLPLAAAAKRGR